MKQVKRYEVVIVALILVVVGLWALRYQTLDAGYRIPTRMDRWTGDVEIYTPTDGWRALKSYKAPPDAPTQALAKGEK